MQVKFDYDHYKANEYLMLPYIIAAIITAITIIVLPFTVFIILRLIKDVQSTKNHTTLNYIGACLFISGTMCLAFYDARMITLCLPDWELLSNTVWTISLCLYIIHTFTLMIVLFYRLWFIFQHFPDLIRFTRCRYFRTGLGSCRLK